MGRKLLLADDSITIQKVVELVLSEEDFQIKAVNNGQDALIHIESYKPDIVLADIEMPHVNGYQLCEKIKKNSSTSHIPVILLAGAFEPLDEELAKNVGSDDYIIKPFESHELISKVNAALTSVSIGEKEVEVEVGTEVGDVSEGVSVVSEEITEDKGAPEPVSVVEAGEEDLWAMEGIEATEVGEDEVWEIDEESVPSSQEMMEGVSPVDLSEDKGEIQGVGETDTDEQMLAETQETLEEVSSGVEEMREDIVEHEPMAEAVRPSPSMGMPEIKMPPEDILLSSFREAMQSQMGDLAKKIDMREIFVESILPTIKDSLEKIIWDLAPELIEKSVKDKLATTFSSVSKEIESVIWETVPDLAENIIKKEIEKIKAGS